MDGACKEVGGGTEDLLVEEEDAGASACGDVADAGDDSADAAICETQLRKVEHMSSQFAPIAMLALRRSSRSPILLEVLESRDHVQRI